MCFFALATGADLGGGGGEGADASFRDSTLYYFEISIFDDGPQNFYKGAFGANIY